MSPGHKQNHRIDDKNHKFETNFSTLILVEKHTSMATPNFFVRMFDLKILASVIFGLILCFIGIKSEQKIKVMFSQSKIENRGLHRLDSKMIENFAKKFKLKIEFKTANETLNETFSNQTLFLKFSHSHDYS